MAGTFTSCSPVSGSGLVVGGQGTLTVATFTPTDTSNTGRWIAVEGTNLSASLVIPGVLATVTGLDVKINKATGGATALDWTQSALGSPGGVDMKVDTLSVSGTVNLTIAGGVISIQGATFALSRQSVALDLNGNGVLDSGTGSTDVASASLLTFALTVPTFTIGSATVGFTMSGATLALAVIGASDGRTWTAIEGVARKRHVQRPAVRLLPPATSLNFTYNTATNANGTTAATALDWTKALDLNADGHFGQAGDQLSVGSNPINMTGAILSASGVATINLGGFVTGSVGFSFTQQTVDVDLNGDQVAITAQAWSANPARGPPGPDVQGATLTTLGLTIPVGQSLTIGAGGVSFNVTKASLSVAIISANGTGDTGAGRRSRAGHQRDLHQRHPEPVALGVQRDARHQRGKRFLHRRTRTPPPPRRSTG